MLNRLIKIIFIHILKNTQYNYQKMIKRIKMEVYEKINEILKITIYQKAFSLKLIELEPKLRNTGEVPTINALYSYLSGDVSLRVELIPYIAEVLDIPEQILFDDSNRARMKILKYIIEDINSQERNFLISKLNIKEKIMKMKIFRKI